jgi:hypothetical protein
MSDPQEQIFQIRTHLLYEVKWLIYAAARFQVTAKDDPLRVALLTSAAVHARNLFEFVEMTAPRAFTLFALNGQTQARGPWAVWANQYVLHMHYRESERFGYPADINSGDPTRFMKMADAALKCLEAGTEDISDTAVQARYQALVGDARAYLEDPTAGDTTTSRSITTEAETTATTDGIYNHAKALSFAAYVDD